jgi:hypothetical protein
MATHRWRLCATRLAHTRLLDPNRLRWLCEGLGFSSGGCSGPTGVLQHADGRVEARHSRALGMRCHHLPAPLFSLGTPALGWEALTRASLACDKVNTVATGSVDVMMLPSLLMLR